MFTRTTAGLHPSTLTTTPENDPVIVLPESQSPSDQFAVVWEETLREKQEQPIVVDEVRKFLTDKLQPTTTQQQK